MASVLHISVAATADASADIAKTNVDSRVVFLIDCLMDGRKNIIFKSDSFAFFAFLLPG